jgi:hypothetical protein
LFVIIAVSILCYVLIIGYGIAQGIGATIGAFLLLAAFKKNDNAARFVLAILAVLVLGPTFLSTQTAYQYASRHADEIIAAGCELMNRWPDKHYIKEAVFGNKNIPSVLRKLGTRSIFIDEERISIYVSGFPYITDREFIIYKNPKPTSLRGSVFIKRSGNKDGMCEITDRLWMTDY